MVHQLPEDAEMEVLQFSCRPARDNPPHRMPTLYLGVDVRGPAAAKALGAMVGDGVPTLADDDGYAEGLVEQALGRLAFVEVDALATDCLHLTGLAVKLHEWIGRGDLWVWIRQSTPVTREPDVVKIRGIELVGPLYHPAQAPDQSAVVVICDEVAGVSVPIGVYGAAHLRQRPVTAPR